MRLFTLTAVLVLAGPAAAAYPPPPKTGTPTGPAVTLQAAPIGKLVEDVRTLIRSVAGQFAEQAVQGFDKDVIGQLNGLDGFDQKKPLGGYVILKDNPEETGAVFAVPYTDEKKFIASISSSKPKATPVPGNMGLYKYDVEGDPAPFPIRIRCHDGYAYISLNLPDQMLDVTAIYTVDKLIDPKETAHLAAKGAVDKIPAALVQLVQKEIVAGLDEMKKDAERSGPNALKAADAFGTYVRRQMAAVTLEGDTLGLKLKVDPKSGVLDQEFVLAGKPGSTLATDIAAWAKTKENRFTGLAGKDATAHGFVKIPFAVPELRDVALAGVAEFEKHAKENMPEVAHALVSELLAGVTRTAKAGDADVAAVLHGPDKDDVFTAVAAVSFADATKVETEVKNLVKAIAPKNIKDAITWDAAKAGAISLHEMKVGDLLPAEAKRVFGDKAVVVVGFGKEAVYAGIGPDARTRVAAAVAAKPAGAGTGPTVLFDTAYNPAKFKKLVSAIEPQVGAAMEMMFGNDDQFVPFLRMAVSGGNQLTVTQSLNLRLYGGMFFFALRGEKP